MLSARNPKASSRSSSKPFKTSSTILSSAAAALPGPSLLRGRSQLRTLLLCKSKYPSCCASPVCANAPHPLHVTGSCLTGWSTRAGGPSSTALAETPVLLNRRLDLARFPGARGAGELRKPTAGHKKTGTLAARSPIPSALLSKRAVETRCIPHKYTEKNVKIQIPPGWRACSSKPKKKKGP